MLVGDITYLPIINGKWCYLASWQDKVSKRVAGWSVSDRMADSLVIGALDKALMRGLVANDANIHSDRGSQYAATSYQQLLDVHGLRPSMSRKGNCWDNACVESFFGTLKRELVYHRQYATRSEATQDIFEYIEVFYNRQRCHSTFGYDSPPSTKRGSLWLNPVSTELVEGH